MAPSLAAAQTAWELTPYRVHVLLAVEPTAELAGRPGERLRAGLASRVDGVVGGHWNATVVDAPAELAQKLLQGASLQADEKFAERLTAEQREGDKILCVAVWAEGSEYRVRAQEYDCRTQFWGVASEHATAQPAALVDVAFAALWEAFNPIAMIESGDKKQAKLKLRAASIPPRDPTLDVVYPNQVWRPIIRTLERDGSLKKLRPVEWTFLQTKSVEHSDPEHPATDNMIVQCAVLTGARNPLGERRRGRVELLAVAVRPPRGSTRIEVASGKGDVRYAGFDVRLYSPETRDSTLLGRTDAWGSLEIPPAPRPAPLAEASSEALPPFQPIRMVLVVNSAAVLAKLPILPGLEPTLRVAVAEDRLRLEVEGFMNGLQEELVDTVAKRQFVISLAQRSLEEGDFEKAEKLLAELRKMRSRQSFAYQIQQEEQRMQGVDRRTKLRVEKMFADTRELLSTFLDPAEIEGLQQTIQRAKQSSTASN